MTRRSLLLVAALLLGLSCVSSVSTHSYRLAQQNQRNINRLRIGQTLAEVEKIMGRGPEKRSTRLRYDGLSIEEWSYLTDLLRHLDTEITFVGGKVEEIRTVSWVDQD